MRERNGVTTLLRRGCHRFLCRNTLNARDPSISRRTYHRYSHLTVEFHSGRPCPGSVSPNRRTYRISNVTDIRKVRPSWINPIHVVTGMIHTDRYLLLPLRYLCTVHDTCPFPDPATLCSEFDTVGTPLQLAHSSSDILSASLISISHTVFSDSVSPLSTDNHPHTFPSGRFARLSLTPPLRSIKS